MPIARFATWRSNPRNATRSVHDTRRAIDHRRTIHPPSQ